MLPKSCQRLFRLNKLRGQTQQYSDASDLHDLARCRDDGIHIECSTYHYSHSPIVRHAVSFTLPYRQHWQARYEAWREHNSPGSL